MRMQSTICSLANRLWVTANVRGHRQFCSAIHAVGQTQESYLLHLLAHNSKTQFGELHRFASIRSSKEYKEKIPISNYEAFAPYIEAIADGRHSPLTADPVHLFQPTSGTMAGSKFIPYTRTLQAEFKRAIAPWIVSLFSRKPDLMKGRAYWSISPPVKVMKQKGSVPVGYGDDSQYLGRLGQWLHSRTTVSPIFNSPDCNNFQISTLVHLLAAPDLRLISVWSPTFLSILLEYLLAHFEDVVESLAKSSFSRALERANEIRSWNCGLSGQDILRRLWPRLGLVSCWMDGPSAIYAERLRQLLPHVEFQGKGLIATEAFVSLPFQSNADPVLALRSHFFEFEDIDSGEVYFAHQLSRGKYYSVIVTTGGGLYRYRLNDVVEITGFIAQCPTLRFIGRVGTVSDLFGEKLDALHVQRSVNLVLNELSIPPRFYLIAPVENGKDQVAYTLFLCQSEALASLNVADVTDKLEKRLRGNFHYDLCRQLGQLSALRLFQIDEKAGNPEELYAQEMQRRGIQLGNIKPATLDNRMGWEHVFSGKFFEANLTAIQAAFPAS